MAVPSRILFIGLCVSVLAAACWQKYAETNHDRAYFAPDGHIYRVELKGRRFPLVHDPVSLLTESTREETFTLELPRVDGVIDAAEIHHNYRGRVAITGGRMTVDLYYPDEDRGPKPLSWNGEYTLLQKDTAATR
jgi:hypothetical protein